MNYLCSLILILLKVDIIQNIKNYLLQRSIKENRPVRKVNLCTFPRAQHIGILVEICNEQDYKDLIYLIHQAHFEKKYIHLLGFYNDKIVPHYCLTQITHDFFCNNQLNWFQKPKSEYITRFCNSKYDMLITYSKHQNIPFKYILATSKAQFITGYSEDLSSYLDLSFSFAHTPSIMEVLNTLDNYTKTLSGQTLAQNSEI